MFPHAEVRPVTVNAGYAMRAWYDIRDLTPEGRDDEQGLEDTRARIETYIARERGRGHRVEAHRRWPVSRRVARWRCMWGCVTTSRLAASLRCRATCRCATIWSREVNPANRDYAHTHVPWIATTWWCCLRSVNISRDALLAAGHPVEWRLYSMGHSLSRAQIGDISAWIEERIAAV